MGLMDFFEWINARWKMDESNKGEIQVMERVEYVVYKFCDIDLMFEVGVGFHLNIENEC